MNLILGSNKLFDDNFYAWMYGPVCPRLYNEFKYLKNEKIVLTNEQMEIVNSICPDHKMAMDAIYETFCDYKTSLLVAITHQEGSPWYKVINKNKEEITEEILLIYWGLEFDNKI